MVELDKLKVGDDVVCIKRDHGAYFMVGDVVHITSITPPECIKGYTDVHGKDSINWSDPTCFDYCVVPIKHTKKAKDITVTLDSATTIHNARAECKCIGLETEREAVMLGVKGNFPILLQGDTGQGKTYIIQSMAKELGKTCIRLSVNGELGTGEVVGKFLAKDGSTYWQDGVITECMRKGHWLIVDEINMALPEILTIFNSILDDGRSLVLAEKDGEVVTPHEDFRIFATMNPPDEYTGTKELNKALVSRFPIFINMGRYSPSTELKIIQYQSGIDKEIGAIMIDVVNCIRKLKDEKKIWYTCGTRDIVNWARLISCNGNTLQETFEYCILNKCSVEDRAIIGESVKTSCAVEFDWKWKKDKFKSLTASMATSIEKMKAEKDSLKISLEELKKMVGTISDKVEVD